MEEQSEEILWDGKRLVYSNGEFVTQGEPKEIFDTELKSKKRLKSLVNLVDLLFVPGSFVRDAKHKGHNLSVSYLMEGVRIGLYNYLLFYN